MKKLVFLLVVTLLFTSLSFTPYRVEAASDGLKDIEGHWAEYHIYPLVHMEILSGYPGNTFKPNNPITRAEYMTVLFKTACVLDESVTLEEVQDEISGYFNYLSYGFNERIEALKDLEKKDYETNYTDLKNHWARDAVMWVKNYADRKKPGLFEKVFPGDKFYPNQAITREEAAVVTVAFLAPPVRSKNIDFKDIPSNYKFKEEIMYLVDNDIINGFSDGTFKPKDNLTRAQAAILMEKILREIAYNMDFFNNSANYTVVINSTADSDYMPKFLNDELYENPPTENDKKYVGAIKCNEIDWQYYPALDQIEGYYEGEEAERLRNELLEEIMKMKEEIPYCVDYYGEKRLEILRELERDNYWNKAGLYYELSQKDWENSLDYLIKAEQYYDMDKNGRDDLLFIYNELIYHYRLEGNGQKIIEYVHKIEDLYDPSTYEGQRVASLDIERFYLYAASVLAEVGEYGRALDYFNKYEKVLLEYGDELWGPMVLEKGALLYINNYPKDKVIKYLQDQLVMMEQNDDYIDQNLVNQYIWAIKTIMRNK